MGPVDHSGGETAQPGSQECRSLLNVLPLPDVGHNDQARVGGKAANLGELITAGFRVPSGFVVTTDAYREATQVAGIATLLDAQGVPGAAGRIRELLAHATISADQRTAIREAYDRLGGGKVAVRSSATAEDLPGAAFAGQQDTFLNVSGSDEVLTAVGRCWASLWTDRAVAYRSRQGFDHLDVQIAVVVQRMVEPDFAGVMFTANPVTGRRDEVVIDANPGLGEAVVSGRVRPDHYVVDRRGKVRERRRGHREVIIRGHLSGGVTEDTSGEGTVESLPESQLADLAQAGAGIAAYFGRPQDIEWASVGAELWIVQSRPLTALPPEPIAVNRLRRVAGAMMAELLPIRPYPLDMSTWTVNGLGRILTRMAWEMAAVRIDLSQVLPEVDGVVDRMVPMRPRPTLRTLITPLRMRSRVRRFRPEVWTTDPRFTEFESHIAAMRAEHHPTMAWRELVQVPGRALELLDGFITLRIDYLPGAGAALIKLWLTLAVLGLRRHFASLVLGGPTKTSEANAALDDLARRVTADPDLRTAFDSLDDGELAAAIDTDPRLADFRLTYQAFQSAYGHRETESVLLMSSPTWSEDPGVLLGAIRATQRRPAADDHHISSTAQAEDAVRRSMIVRCTRSAGVVLHRAQAVRAGLALREDTHFHATRPLPLIRSSLLEAGHRLHRAGVLSQREDILHLRLDEITSIDDPGAIEKPHAELLRATIAKRSQRRAELAGAPLISPETLYPSRRAQPGALVTGIPAGGGSVTGPVRIVRSPNEFDTLRAGEVLVCRYTNPSWTPLFALAAAVVVDSGSVGSHAAIVAREYGIAAVVATGYATTVLSDGQVVTVDGRRGTVSAAEPARAEER